MELLPTINFALPRGGEFSLPAEWWIESGMTVFRCEACAYRPVASPETFEVSLADIRPLNMDRRKHLSYGGFDRQRMLEVLTDVAQNSALYPIVIRKREDPPYRFEIRDGTHRFYASVAAGFSQIPCVLQDDW